MVAMNVHVHLTVPVTHKGNVIVEQWHLVHIKRAEPMLNVVLDLTVKHNVIALEAILMEIRISNVSNINIFI